MTKAEKRRYGHSHGISDLALLSLLSFAAAFRSWNYVGNELHYPDAFVALHILCGALFFLSIRFRKLVPIALAAAFGTFIGRATALGTAILVGRSSLPSDLLLLAAIQWTVLAWIIRPRRILGPAPDTTRWFGVRHS